MKTLLSKLDNWKFRKAAMIALAFVLVMGLVYYALPNTTSNLATQAVDMVRDSFTLKMADAAGTADATCDGAADEVQTQALVTALPAAGGRLYMLTGTYVWTNGATVTDASPGITITGTGVGTSITGSGATSPFTAGGNNWILEDLKVSVNTATLLAAMGATTGWEWRNVTTSDGYYALRTSASGSVALGSLTSGRVPIVGGGGTLTDDTTLLYDAGTDTLTATEFVGGGAGLTGIGAGVTTGTTFPVAPTDGQLFLHNPTGRNILYEYDGSAWQPIQSYGTITVYVDNTDGADTLVYNTTTPNKGGGTAVDAYAFKTIQYAYSIIPEHYDSTVTININAEIYSGNLILQNKTSLTGAYINFVGTMNVVSTGNTIQSATAGTAIVKGTVTDTGVGAGDNLFTGNANSLLVVSGPAELYNKIMILDSVTDDTGTIGGGFLTGAAVPSTPTGTFAIWNWTGGTKITGQVSCGGETSQTPGHVIFQYIDFNSDTGVDVIAVGYGTQLSFEGCRFNKMFGLEIGASAICRLNLWLATSYVVADANAYVEFVYGNKMIGGTGNPLGYSIWAYDGGTVRLDWSNVFDGVDKTNTGIFSTINSHVYIDAIRTAYGNNYLRNWNIAFLASKVSFIDGTSGNTYTNNNFNYSSSPGTGAFIDGDYIGNLFKGLKGEAGSIVTIPTSSWSTIGSVGSGAAVQSPTRIYVETGATNSSEIMAYAFVNQINPGNADTTQIDFNTDLIVLDFNVARTTSTATCIARAGLRQGSDLTVDDPTNICMGIKFDNLTLYSETLKFGSALDNTSLGVTVTDGVVYHITIISYPTTLTRRVEWYVNNVLKLTDSTADHMPDSTGSNMAMAISILKGAVADTDYLSVGNISMWYRPF